MLLGIDLGTSSVKATVIDERGVVLAAAAREYAIHTPQIGYAEQNPEDWYRATCDAVRQIVAEADAAASVWAIGFSGQMHGTVLLNAQGRPVQPAIIWADQRGAALIPEITERGAELWPTVGTLPAVGFMAVTLYWFMRHHPQIIDQTTAIVLPKDYLCFRFTGEISTEPSDAASTALLDIAKREWSHTLVTKLGLPGQLLPNIRESHAVVGTLNASAAGDLGLPSGIPVVAGCADQAAQALGSGLLEQRLGSVTIGTGGQLFVPLNAPRVDALLRLHTFCHAPPDQWYVLGAMLSAGLSLRWLRNILGMADDLNGYEQLAAHAAAVPIGAEGLLFLPYLIGERAPLMDAKARGGFVGLTLSHGVGHMARAVMEGVAFNLRQIFEIVKDFAPVDSLIASGNGLANPVWRQIVADVLNRPLRFLQAGERAGVGAALLGGIGTGIIDGFDEATALVRASQVEHSLVVEPNPQASAAHNEHFARYGELYPALRGLFHRL